MEDDRKPAPDDLGAPYNDQALSASDMGSIWDVLPSKIPAPDHTTASRLRGEKHYKSSSEGSLKMGYHPSASTATLVYPGKAHNTIQSMAYFRKETTKEGNAYYCPTNSVPPASDMTHVHYYNNKNFLLPTSDAQFSRAMELKLHQMFQKRGYARAMLDNYSGEDDQVVISEGETASIMNQLLDVTKMYNLVYNFSIMGGLPKPLDVLLAPFHIIISMMGYSIEEAYFGKDTMINIKNYGVVARENWKSKGEIPEIALGNYLVKPIEKVHRVLDAMAKDLHGNFQRLPPWIVIKKGWLNSMNAVHRLWFVWPDSQTKDVRAQVIHWVWSELEGCQSHEQMVNKIHAKVQLMIADLIPGRKKQAEPSFGSLASNKAYQGLPSMPPQHYPYAQHGIQWPTHPSTGLQGNIAGWNVARGPHSATLPHQPSHTTPMHYPNDRRSATLPPMPPQHTLMHYPKDPRSAPSPFKPKDLKASFASPDKYSQDERGACNALLDLNEAKSGTASPRDKTTNEDDNLCMNGDDDEDDKEGSNYNLGVSDEGVDYKESDSVPETDKDIRVPDTETENNSEEKELETKEGKTTKSASNVTELNVEKSTENGRDDQKADAVTESPGTAFENGRDDQKADAVTESPGTAFENGRDDQKADAVTESPGTADTDVNASSKQPEECHLQAKQDMEVVVEDETAKSNLPVEDKSETQPTNGNKRSQKTKKGENNGPKKKKKKSIKKKMKPFNLPKRDRDLYGIHLDNMPECDEEEEIVFNAIASSAACKKRRGEWKAGGKDWVNDCRRIYNSMCLLHCRMNNQGLIGEGWEEEDALAVVVGLKMHPAYACQRGDVEACMATWLGSVEAKQAVVVVGQIGAALRGRGIWTALEEKLAIDKAWDEVDAAMNKKAKLNGKAYAKMYYDLREKYMLDNRRENVAKIVDACFLEQTESSLMCQSELCQFLKEF